MTSTVQGDDYVSQSCYVMAVNTLSDRIEWILEARGVSQRELSRRAGLKEPHVGLIIKRFRADPAAGIEQATLMGLAKAGDVSLQWLSTGEGTPDGKPGASERSGALDEDLRVMTDDDEQIEEWIHGALNKGKHKTRHKKATRAFLRARAPKMQQDADMTAFAGRVLDMAAWLDSQGKPIDPDAIFYALVVENAPRHAFHDPDEPSDLAKEADEELRAMGIDPPGWKYGKKKPAPAPPRIGPSPLEQPPPTPAPPSAKVLGTPRPPPAEPPPGATPKPPSSGAKGKR